MQNLLFNCLVNNFSRILNHINQVNPINHGSEDLYIIKGNSGKLKVETKEDKLAGSSFNCK
jgi:hypothetical protein